MSLKAYRCRNHERVKRFAVVWGLIYGLWVILPGFLMAKSNRISPGLSQGMGRSSNVVFEQEVDPGLFHALVKQQAELGLFDTSARVQADPDSLSLDPKKILTKSLILPGWGQLENQQAWKIPVIYGAFTGAGFYLSDLTKRYHDYRAAVYNISRGEESDLKFGDTPTYIPENANLTELQRLRDSYRNKRDFAFIIVGILYGLNALDAYVYAHMRSFDVSDDLSARITITPTLSPQQFGSSSMTLVNTLPHSVPAFTSQQFQRMSSSLPISSLDVDYLNSTLWITPGVRVRISIR